MAQTAKLVSASRGKLLNLLKKDTVPEPVYSQGSVREYLVTDVPTLVTKSRAVSSKELLYLGALIAIALSVRLSNLENPKSVVFDEVHFGGFAQKYILGKFFMDVHPPLAKLMFAAVAQLGGFRGDFDFAKIGDVYPENVPYVLMRTFSAVLGVATVVLAHLTLRSSGVRPFVALATSACLLFENSYVTISKYILLDLPLVFFIAAAVYAFKKFEIQQPFSVAWFRALLACSVSLGLALSSKWVGLFTVVWCGVGCVIHMWFLIGDLSVRPVVVVKHAVARASLLLGIPLVIYLAVFYVHFSVLTLEGPGSAFMSSAFRAGFPSSKVPKSTLANVGFGSVVTLKHVNTRGGYLHSHEHFYPTGSKQQQITLYPHLDKNNDWLIEPYNETIPDHFVPLKDGTKIRLKHVKTQRRLHSHDEKPPVSERDWQKECSCYGFDGFEGDANDDWIVEIVPHKSVKGIAQEELRSISTIFRLKHAMSGHYLFATDTKLPDWGFSQLEVTAASQGSTPLTYWFIEGNVNDRVPAENRVEVSYPKLSFWQKVVEAHRVMYKINNGLTAHHVYQSEPHEWPLLLRGISYWAGDNTQVYFIGNPVVWWTASAIIFAFGVHAVISILKWQTGSSIATNKDVFSFNFHMVSYLAGWAAHYFPFFIMGRQLFLHHYLPAQYFAILGLGHVFELFVARTSRFGKTPYIVLTAFLAATVAFYHSLSPLSSALPWTRSKCEASKLVASWDYNCNSFFESIEKYASLSQPQAAPLLDIPASVLNEAAVTLSAVKEQVSQDVRRSLLTDKLMDPVPEPETHLGPMPAHLDGEPDTQEEKKLSEKAAQDSEKPAPEPVVEAKGPEPVEPVKEAVQESLPVVEDIQVDDVVVENAVLGDSREPEPVAVEDSE